MPLFVEKLKSSTPDIQAAIMVSHNNTDTGWFHSIAEVAAAICFPAKRIKFYRGGDVAAPANGQMFIYIGDDVPAFSEVFGEFGLVVVPA